MGVRRHQYARELEKNISEGKNLKQAHKKAAELSDVNRVPKTRTGKDAPDKKSLLEKTKRRLKELWGGKKTYLKKDKKK